MFFFFKQKTAYEMRISDWSSDVCSSDLSGLLIRRSWVRVPPGAREPSLAGRARVRRRCSASAAGTGPSLVWWLRLVRRRPEGAVDAQGDRQRVELGKSVSVRVALGGRSIIKTTKSKMKRN